MTSVAENLTNGSNDLSSRQYKCGEFENNLSKWTDSRPIVIEFSLVVLFYVKHMFVTKMNNYKNKLKFVRIHIIQLFISS